MRTRSTTTGSLTSDLNEVHYTLPGGDPVLWSQTYSGSQQAKTISDVVTPGFHSLKRCGKFLPINPTTITTVVDTHTPGPVNFTDTRYDSVFEGTYFGGMGDFTIPVPPPDDALIEASILASAANAAAAEWDVMTFLAEFQKSAELMASIGSRFNKKTFDLARQARRWRRDPWGRFRELWLEARYGIRPIIYDFKSAYAAFATYKDKLEVIKGKGFESGDAFDQVDTGWEPTSNPGFESRIIETLNQEIGYRGKTFLRYTGAVGQHGRSFGFDPLLTAWELVPYSFVVDWFVNIGAYVQAIQPVLSGNVLGIGGSVRIKQTQTLTFQQRGVSYIAGSYGVAEKKRVTESYERFPSGVPLPPLLPKLTLPKIVDLVALFVGGRNKVTSTLNRR